jgi:hypothetical protein
MRTSKSREREKRNNLQVRMTIDSRPTATKQPHRPHGCSSRAMQAKRKNYAPELYNQRNCTTLLSCTTNLSTQGARNSRPPPPLLYKNEKTTCATMDRRERKQRIKQQKCALTRRRRAQPQTLGRCSRGKEETRATTEATYAHNRPSLPGQLVGT